MDIAKTVTIHNTLWRQVASSLFVARLLHRYRNTKIATRTSKKDKTMGGINGSSKAQPMEMETLNPGDFRPPPPHPIDQMLTLMKLYMESYPKITTVIVFSLIGLLMLALTPNFQSTVIRNRLQHDYSSITQDYNFKASQLDHWCLWVSLVRVSLGTGVVYTCWRAPLTKWRTYPFCLFDIFTILFQRAVTKTATALTLQNPKVAPTSQDG